MRPARDVALVRRTGAGVGGGRGRLELGEAFHELGRAIEDRAPHVLVAGLSPEWHGYLPVPFTDGYEESLSYGPEAVAAIARALTMPDSLGPALGTPAAQ